jgi:hypothetical protein
MTDTTLTHRDGHEDRAQVDLLIKMDNMSVGDMFGSNKLDEMPASGSAEPPKAAASGAQAAVVDAPFVAGQLALPPLIAGGKRATPDTPLKKAAAVHRLLLKFQVRITNVLLKMNSMKYQNELKVKLTKNCEEVGKIYTALGELLKSGVDSDAHYAPILKEYIDLKKLVESDVVEGEDVCGSVGKVKVQKQPGAPPSGKKARKANVKKEP